MTYLITLIFHLVSNIEKQMIMIALLLLQETLLFSPSPKNSNMSSVYIKILKMYPQCTANLPLLVLISKLKAIIGTTKLTTTVTRGTPYTNVEVVSGATCNSKKLGLNFMVEHLFEALSKLFLLNLLQVLKRCS